jgi:hypothetical protein
MNRSFTGSMDIISSTTKSGWPDSSSGKFFLVSFGRQHFHPLLESILVVSS